MRQTAEVFRQSLLRDFPLPLSAMVELPGVLPEAADRVPRVLEGLAGHLWEVQLLADPEWLFSQAGAPFLARLNSWGIAAALHLPPSALSRSRAQAMVGGKLHRLSLILDRLPPSGEEGERFWGTLRDRVDEIREFQRLGRTTIPSLRLDIGRMDARRARLAGVFARAGDLGVSEIVGAAGKILAPDDAGERARAVSPPGALLSRLRRRLKKMYLREIALPPSIDPAVPAGSGEARKDCLFPWAWTYLSRRGEVRPCPVSRRSMGSLRNQDFVSIWNGPDYQAFRRRLLSSYPREECRSCLFRPWFSPPAPAGWIWAGINDRFGVQLGTGWHEREEGRPYRWSRKEGTFLLRNSGGKKLKLVLHLPSGKLAQEGEVFIDGERAGGFRLRRPGDHLLVFPLPPGRGEEVTVKLVAGREIVPRDVLGNDDLRRLGVAWKGAFLV